MRGDRRNVTRNAALVGALTSVSRLLGLVREMLTAQFFGTSALQSAFVVAFTIPNLFRRLFGEGALSAAFVPAFTHSRTRNGDARALQMARRLLSSAGALLISIAAAGILISLLAGRNLEEGGKLALTLPLLRIMLPYAPLICLTALCMGMLNVLGDFRIPAITPALLNIVWIGTLLLVCPLLPNSHGPRITAVAASVTLAGCLQFGLLWNVLRRRGWMIRPERGSLEDSQVRRVWRTSLPAALGAGAVQINVCIDFMLAYWAADWAPSTLTYADRILYLPTGIIATAYGTVLLPTFSRLFAENDHEGIRETLHTSLSDIMLLMAPAMAGLLVLAGPVVAVLYEHGEFTALATTRTARALACYAPGLLVFSLHKVLTPLFYGMGDTRTPMLVSLGAVVLNLVLNVIFVLTWPQEWKHAGIASSTVICSAISSFVLARLARRKLERLGWSSVWRPLARPLAAALLMAVAARLVWTWTVAIPFMADSAGTKKQAVFALLLTIAAAGLVYLGVLYLIDPAAVRRLAGILRRKRLPQTPQKLS